VRHDAPELLAPTVTRDEGGVSVTAGAHSLGVAANSDVPKMKLEWSVTMTDALISIRWCGTDATAAHDKVL
jgi:hypothetical protein